MVVLFVEWTLLITSRSIECIVLFVMTSYFRKLADDGMFVHSSLYADEPFMNVMFLAYHDGIDHLKVRLLFNDFDDGGRACLFI